MTVYYVAKSGNDSNAGTSHGAPKLTIASALTVATTNGDVVEIIDEGTYSENNLNITINNLSIRHTASQLGRPVIDATGGGSAFRVSGEFATYEGLEIKGGTSYTFNDLGAGYDKFHLTGCFIHETPKLTHTTVNNTSGTPSSIKQSILFFDGTQTGMFVENGLEIINCLITASAGTNPLIYGFSATTNTASFSTFIHRGASNTGLIVQSWSKVINCIVSGSGKGIGSDDHTSNLLDVSGEDFRNYADNSNGSAGTGDVVDTDPEFEDGSAIGGTVEVYESFKLASISSPAVGTADGTFRDKDGNLITTDLAGEDRPNPLGGSYDKGAYEFVQVWSDYTPDRERKWGSDLTINATQNSLDGRKYALRTNNRQAPYSQTIRGVPSIRLRSTPAKTEK